MRFFYGVAYSTIAEQCPSHTRSYGSQLKVVMMRLSLVALLLFPLTLAFTVGGRSVRISTRLCSMAEQQQQQGEKKKLTSQDILARARKAAGIPGGEEKEEELILFEDQLLVDMRESLLLLEKRIKEGPGSISVKEMENLEGAMQRILKDMKQKVADGVQVVAVARPAPAAPGTASTPAASAATASIPAYPPAATATIPAHPAKGTATGPAYPPAVSVPHQPPAAPAQSVVAESQQGVQVRQSEEVADTSNDETPAYDGTGGMGLAKGTANTYIIPGMDEMEPEEYRKALQQAVSDRQTKRRESRKGVVGNRAALQYLDQLGYGGASNNWQSNEGDDEKNSWWGG